MTSTLSTGLNKSESFIKTNATRIYTRELRFKNKAKVYLDEDYAIPSGEIDTKHYIHCSSIGYFENYHICHQSLSIWIHYDDNTIKTTRITPEQIDQNGLLPRLSSALNSIGVSMRYNKQINGYQGFKLAFNDILNISQIESNYHFAWMIGIIHKYDEGKSAQDKLLLFRKSPQHDILLGLYSSLPVASLSTPPSINILNAKTIYPLFNGGFNRITISSDLLATLQYINGHKTATIAKLQIGHSKNSQMNPMEISNSFDWKHEYFYFTMKKHEQHLPHTIMPLVAIGKTNGKPW